MEYVNGGEVCTMICITHVYDTCMYVRIHVHKHTHNTHTHTHSLTHTRTHIHTHTQTHTHTQHMQHIYAHTQTHLHIHTQHTDTITLCNNALIITHKVGNCYYFVLSW